MSVSSKHISEYNCSLDCFSGEFTFPVPDTITRSTTADIVSTGTTTKNKQSSTFSMLRENLKDTGVRTAWRNACVTVETFGNTPSVNLKIYSDLEKSSAAYEQALLTMAENGIWNCGEFADFAELTINNLAKNYKLKEMYIAKVVSLNNSQIPEASVGENHDHAFVLITDRQKTPLFVIDLWQGLVTGTPFFGTVSEYFNILRANPDGYYVRPGVVSQHIGVVDHYSLAGASGASEGFSPYEPEGPGVLYQPEKEMTPLRQLLFSKGSSSTSTKGPTKLEAPKRGSSL